MKSRITITGIMATVSILFVIGCYNKRIVWSPDGKWGAVCSDTGLYFTDAEGHITQNMHRCVFRAAWFPDSRHLAIEEFTDITSWDELQKTVSSKEQQKLMHYARALLSVRNQTEWEAETKNLLDSSLLSETELTAVKLYIRAKHSDSFPDGVMASWEPNPILQYHFLRIGVWDGNRFAPGKTLWSSFERIWDMRLCPQGRIVVFTSAYPDKGEDEFLQLSSLWAADCETGRTVLLDKHTALYPDWDADGQSLFYVRFIGEDRGGNAIGTLLQIELCDCEGVLLELFPQPKSLAGLISNKYTKIRCLSDGRIIFSSMELTLPAVQKDFPGTAQLFVMDPARQATVAPLIPRNTLDQTSRFNLDFFEVSPDETMISLLDDEGRVAVLILATGDFTLLQGDKLGSEIVVPVWRYPKQLCYIGEDNRTNGSPGQEKYKHVFLRSPEDAEGWGQPRSISQDWPAEVKQDWLE